MLYEVITISQHIWNESASTIAFDVGLTFRTPFDGLRLGAVLSNFGGDMQLDGKDLTRRIDLDPENTGNNETIVANLKTDSWELPLFFRAGISYDLQRSDLFTATISADAVRPNDNNEHVNLGGEFGYRDILFVRVITSYSIHYTKLYEFRADHHFRRIGNLFESRRNNFV